MGDLRPRARGRWNWNESESAAKIAWPPTFKTTKGVPSNSRGRKHAPCSTVCRAAGSISPMRRSTGTCWPAAATSSRCAGSGATTRFAISPTQPCARRRTGLPMSWRSAGLRKGDRVFSLLGRVPELYIAALGTLKNGSVFSPLFSAFGPEPIKARMTIGDAKVLVTSEAFYRRKIEPWRRELGEPGACLLDRLLERASGRHDRSGRGLGAGVGLVRDRADRARGHGPAALHQRHDRTAEGRGARARGRRRPSRHRPARARSAPGRHLLVHRRPRLGDRHLLRHHLAADQRRRP